MRTAAAVALILVGASFIASLAGYLAWSHVTLQVGLGGPILTLLGAEGVASAVCLAVGVALLVARRKRPAAG